MLSQLAEERLAFCPKGSEMMLWESKA